MLYLLEPKQPEQTENLTMSQTKERAQLIDRIIAVARKPVPEIRESRQLLADNGQWYSPLGFPLGVRMVEPAQIRVVGYVYVSHEGTTYGTRHASRDEAIAKWEAYQDRQAAEFRQVLDESTDQRVQEQAAYWLKEYARLGVLDPRD